MPVETQRFPSRRAAWLVFCCVFTIALCFALYTRHVWEDYFITYRCSKNLATGQGLVFTPGERVHAFTSPLNTLIPAALSVATGNTSDRLVLWLWRILSCAALAGAAVLLYQIARSQSFGRLATFTLVGLFATLPAIVDFSINGQETGLMMFFLALAMHSLAVPTGRATLRLGIAWAGLMWTRPDGFVYAAGIAGGWLLFNPDSAAQRSRLQLLKTYFLAGAIATVLYLPWVLWAWWYFGSPVPHTIVAKGFGREFGLLPLLETTSGFLRQLFSAKLDVLDVVFAPPYALLFPEWPQWMFTGCRLLAWIAGVYWVLPFGHRPTRAISFAFFVGLWYLCVVTQCVFPWYLPNIAILAACVVGQIVQHLASILRVLRDMKPAQEYLVRLRDGVLWRAEFLHRAVAVAIPAFSVSMLLMCGFQMRIQQREVERGNRMQIGVWLRENAASSKDSVFLEPLGYIGYFSQLKMLDWPGLCAPEVVAARRRTGSWAQLINALHPDWLVLRPSEEDQIRRDDPRMFAERYLRIKVFDVSERLKAYSWIPGRRYPMCDQTFTVFRRSDAKTKGQPAASQARLAGR